MNLKTYRVISDWKLIRVDELKIIYLEGIIDSKLYRSERLISFHFYRREAVDSFTVYELGSINQEFASASEDQGILFSNYDFS